MLGIVKTNFKVGDVINEPMYLGRPSACCRYWWLGGGFTARKLVYLGTGSW